MKELMLTKNDLNSILEFVNKYPEQQYITLSFDNSSGIGYILNASVNSLINGDNVTITKSIVDVDTW